MREWGGRPHPWLPAPASFCAPMYCGNFPPVVLPWPRSGCKGVKAHIQRMFSSRHRHLHVPKLRARRLTCSSRDRVTWWFVSSERREVGQESTHYFPWVLETSLSLKMTQFYFLTWVTALLLAYALRCFAGS